MDFWLETHEQKIFFLFALEKVRRGLDCIGSIQLHANKQQTPWPFSLSFLFWKTRAANSSRKISLSLSPSSPSNNLFCCSQKRMRVVGGRKLNRCTAYYSTHTVDGMVNTLPSRSIEKCGRIVGEREGWICTAAHWSIGCVGKSGRRQRGLSLSQAAGHSPPCL